MVAINIAVETNDPTQLRDLLTHVMKEITDPEYRSESMNSNRKVDMNWVHMDEGKYNWSRNDRS